MACLISPSAVNKIAFMPSSSASIYSRSIISLIRRQTYSSLNFENLKIAHLDYIASINLEESLHDKMNLILNYNDYIYI